MFNFSTKSTRFLGLFGNKLEVGEEVRNSTMACCVLSISVCASKYANGTIVLSESGNGISGMQYGSWALSWRQPDMNTVDLARSVSVFLRKFYARYGWMVAGEPGKIVAAQLRTGIPKLRKVGAPGVSFKIRRTEERDNHDYMGISPVAC